jgi:hypothetical protein
VNGSSYFDLNRSCEAWSSALELAPGVADPAGLARAAGRVVLGVEVEDDGLAAQLRELDHLPAVARELEVRSRFAFFDHAGTLATLKRVKRAWSEMNPTLRGFLIIGLIVAVVVALQLQATVFSLLLLARIAFFLAIAYFIFLMWRDRRQEISMWSARSRAVFYGAAVLLVVNVAVRFWEPVGGGWNLIAFLAVFVLAGFAMWRVWRDEHSYGY